MTATQDQRKMRHKKPFQAKWFAVLRSMGLNRANDLPVAAFKDEGLAHEWKKSANHRLTDRIVPCWISVPMNPDTRK